MTSQESPTEEARASLEATAEGMGILSGPEAALIKAALEEAEAELQAVYRKLWPLREAYAEQFPPADLPARRRDRTEKQNLVARCPRCGGRLEPDPTLKVPYKPPKGIGKDPPKV